MQCTHDILIVGGGMAGAGLACALSGSGYRTGIIEAHAFGKSTRPPSYDDRSVALAYGSRRILEGIGLWPRLAMHATPIHSIHVSQQGRFGVTRLHSHDEHVDALGYIIENRHLGVALYEQLATANHIEFLTPASVTSIVQQTDHIEVNIEQASGEKRQLHARLLIGADGAESIVRRQLNISKKTHSYSHSAIVCNVSPQNAHNNIAYERFTRNGPLALLPMSEGRCSVVWTHPESRAEEILQYTDEQFLGSLQAAFGYRMGRFVQTGKRFAYPLLLTQSQSIIAERAVLVGNAANTLHPVAGQGFNLALRDIAMLAELLVSGRRQNSDPGDAALLKDYAHWRKKDISRVTSFTDLLARVFINPFPPLVHARSAGLSLLDKCPTARHYLARNSMGLSGKLSRLSCGLSLEFPDA